MLMHHAAFPGIDHDLQQVASQFLCVPPWKVDHAKRAAEWEAKQKEAAKGERAKEKEAKKAVRVAEHEARNAEKAAEKAAKKAQRQAEHQARNAALAADKKARKAAKKGGAPVVLPGQLPLPLTSDAGPSMADEDTSRCWGYEDEGPEEEP